MHARKVDLIIIFPLHESNTNVVHEVGDPTTEN